MERSREYAYIIPVGRSELPAAIRAGVPDRLYQC